ncbi:hypothetical protein C8R43DRAFT_878000 [Mycena crocata]|nr:hypothetical protein C8R43DRAFT_878000 [Mycena crocata]
MDHNRNPSGKNQYHHGKNDVDDEKEARMAVALTKYHSDGITKYETLRRLLEKQHNIVVGRKTVQRRLGKLGLHAGHKTMQRLGHAAAEQLIVSEMDKDVAKRHGVRTIKAKVARYAGEILPRRIVSDIMHAHDAAAFDTREPTAKKIHRTPKYVLGVHQQWAGDGHDKLYKIGFPIYGWVDAATSWLLQGKVCPSNRLATVVVYLFLLLVLEYGGMPVQITTDCGSETTELYAVVNALRLRFHPDWDPVEVPPHVYLRSVHNVSVERSWFRLRLDFGDNAVLKFQEGIIEGWYNPHDPDQLELCQFLWSRIIQAELDDTMGLRNAAPMRKQKEKPGPSGMSRQEAFTLYEDWGGKNCILPIPRDVVEGMIADLGGDSLLEFTKPAFTAIAQEVLDALQPVQMTLDNGWKLFRVMLPQVFPERGFPIVEL